MIYRLKFILILGFVYSLVINKSELIAQETIKLPEKYTETFQIANSITLNTDMSFGISQLNNEIKTFNSLTVKAYLEAIKNPDNKTTNGKKQIIIGFLGIETGFIKSRSDFFAKKPESIQKDLILARVISAIVKRNKIDMNLSNLSNTFLLIFSKNENAELFEDIKDLGLPIPENQQFFYILWDKGMVNELPYYFKSKSYVSLNIASESVAFENIKSDNISDVGNKENNEIKKTENDIADIPLAVVPAKVGTSEIPEKIKKDDAVTPVPEKEEIKEQIEVKKENNDLIDYTKPTKEKKEDEEEQILVIESDDNLIFNEVNPEIHSVLAICFKEFLLEKENNISSYKSAKFFLANNNSRIKVSNISTKSNTFDTTVYFNLTWDYYKIGIQQDIMDRRRTENDPEIQRINQNIYPLLKYYVKGQEVFPSKQGSELILPAKLGSFKDLNIVLTDSNLANLLKSEEMLMEDKSKQILLSFKYHKSKIKFNISNKLTGEEINDVSFYVDLSKKKIIEEILSSNVVIDKLYKSDKVNYDISFVHEDYKLFRRKLSSKNWAYPYKVEMEPKNSYNIIFVEVSNSDNKRIFYQELEKKLKKIKEINHEFILFLSNGNKPFVCKTNEDFTIILNKILVISPDQPQASVDKKFLIDNIDMNAFNKAEKINFYYFLSKNVMQQAGNLLIDDIVNELSKRENYSVYINSNYMPDEKEKSRKNYKYFKL